MGSRYEADVTVISAKDLKNVNWRYGDLKPYAVLWVDPVAKGSTKADLDRDTNPNWDEKVTVPLGDRRIDDAVLYIDIVHANADKDTKPLIGSARIPLREVVDEVGIGGRAFRSLKLKRPSGRPHGKIDVKIAVREPSRYYEPPPPSYGSPYGQASSRDYGGSYGYAKPYSAPPPSGYPYSAPPPSGYPYSAPPAQPAYSQAPAPAYGQPSYGQPSPAYAVPQDKQKSKFGMGTGLAVGAVAGVLGGLALGEGIEYMENKIADDAAEKVEEDRGYDDDGGYGGDDGDYGGDDW